MAYGGGKLPKSVAVKHEKGRRGDKLPYFELTISVRENARAVKRQRRGKVAKKEKERKGEKKEA